MTARRLQSAQAIDTWRKRPVFRVQIVNSDSAAVVFKSARTLVVGKRVSFARVSDLEGGTRGDWRSGVIWRIDKGCLHLTRT